MNYKMGELFCGAGGLGLAAIRAQCPEYGISHAWATDYNLDACATYTHNICPDKPNTVLCEDIRLLDYKKLAQISKINALVFGFPCNDFSVVGEQKGFGGEFGPLYQYGIKAMEIFKPDWFLAENVGGLRNANKGCAFSTILEEMDAAGYRITPQLYKFNEYGVPQSRQRVIIIGIKKSLGKEFLVPSPEDFADIDVTVRNAIENPPILKDAFNNELTLQSRAVQERLSYIKPGENAFTASLPEHLQLHVKGAKISQIYKRLHPDKPAYTITGSGGGGTHVYHWSENRALTNRERARLQTFPDDFEFLGSKESVRKQIGMAVPYAGAKVIFEAVLKTLAGIPYKSIPAKL
jgi:DNA (cytosine-5)-methyltransferase 1